MTPKTTVLPNGKSVFCLSPSDTLFIYKEIFEDESMRKHGIILRDGDCVMDVGANIGLFTLFVTDSCRNATVYAFEPIPDIFETLRLNTNLTNHRIIPLPIGLGSESRTAEFTYYPRVSTISTLHPEGSEEMREGVRSFLMGREIEKKLKASRAAFLLRLPMFLRKALARFVTAYLFKPKRVACQVRILSEVISEQGISRIDLLKIDAEGSEEDILAGIQENDWGKIRQLVVEVQDMNGALERVGELLSKRGYAIESEYHPFTEHLIQLGSPPKNLVYNVYAKKSENFE